MDINSNNSVVVDETCSVESCVASTDLEVSTETSPALRRILADLAMPEVQGSSEGRYDRVHNRHNR
mgnify:CR=1 FL=1